MFGYTTKETLRNVERTENFVKYSPCRREGGGGGVQVGTMHPVQIKISINMQNVKTNLLISPVKKTCDSLPHPRVAFVEILALEIIYFKNTLKV